MSKKNKDKEGVVFSTDPNFTYQYTPNDEEETPEPKQQLLRISLDRKQRAGKEVTLIDAFIGTTADLEKLGKELKNKCGTGGTVKDNQIVIQGDHRKKISELLNKMGYKFKLI